MAKVLASRFGGIGDVAPVVAALKQLHKRGDDVTLALREDGVLRQTDLYQNQDWLKLLDYRQIGPWGTRCVKYEHGWIEIEATYDDYDQVIDFMFVIEACSNCKTDIVKRPTDLWKRSRNSNWVNWYDHHLAWAGIDPTSVPDEEKRPEFTLSNREKEIAKGIKDNWSHVITMNPVASSLARTWYQAQDLIPMIMDKYENPLIIVWNPQSNDWIFHSKNGKENIKIDLNSGLRKSLTILGASDLYIGVDTGLSHMAEGLNLKHIAIYSTVPWWTRAKYYKYQTHIDQGVDHPEYYTFCLQAGDPLNMVEGEDGLTKREKRIQELYNTQTPMNVVTKELNTDSHGAGLELEALKKKLQSFERIQSKSLSSVTPEFVFSKVEELCK